MTNKNSNTIVKIVCLITLLITAAFIDFKAQTINQEGPKQSLTINFEKITFKSTPCYGPCPYMLLEINQNDSFFFKGIKNTGNFTGSFNGRLEPDEMQKLISILEVSKLDSFRLNLGRVIDAPVYTFIIHYNEKTIISKGYPVPEPQKALLNFLLNFYKTADLKKSKTEHTFELE